MKHVCIVLTVIVAMVCSTVAQAAPAGEKMVVLLDWFVNPDHAPFSNGYIPAAHTFDTPTQATIAGLDVHFYPAPSDATDSVTIWFPSLSTTSLKNLGCLPLVAV